MVAAARDRAGVVQAGIAGNSPLAGVNDVDLSLRALRGRSRTHLIARSNGSRTPVCTANPTALPEMRRSDGVRAGEGSEGISGGPGCSLFFNSGSGFVRAEAFQDRAFDIDKRNALIAGRFPEPLFLFFGVFTPRHTR